MQLPKTDFSKLFLNGTVLLLQGTGLLLKNSKFKVALV